MKLPFSIDEFLRSVRSHTDSETIGYPINGAFPKCGASPDMERHYGVWARAIGSGHRRPCNRTALCSRSRGASIPCWWFALRGLAWLQRLLTGFLAVLLTSYAAALVWVGLAHKSARSLLLGTVIAIPCWRFAFREKRAIRDESST
jgi:hypothetical protein